MCLNSAQAFVWDHCAIWLIFSIAEIYFVILKLSLISTVGQQKKQQQRDIINLTFQRKKASFKTGAEKWKNPKCKKAFEFTETIEIYRKLWTMCTQRTGENLNQNYQVRREFSWRFLPKWEDTEIPYPANRRCSTGDARRRSTLMYCIIDTFPDTSIAWSVLGKIDFLILALPSSAILR